MTVKCKKDQIKMLAKMILSGASIQEMPRDVKSDSVMKAAKKIEAYRIRLAPAWAERRAERSRRAEQRLAAAFRAKVAAKMAQPQEAKAHE